MKKRIVVSLICFVVMASLPLIASGGENKENSNYELNSEHSSSEVSRTVSENSAVKEQYFKILDEDTGDIVTVDDRTFCYGAVAAEMLPGFQSEALKAQCVAAYTHFCRLRNEQRETPDSSLKGADFSADLSDNQYYMSNEAMKEKWGSLYDESYQNIKSAVDDVFGEVLTDDSGELITVAYHAISSGTTETFADVFGEDISYLQAVPSPGDLVAPGYLSEKSISEKDFKNKILSSNNKADVSETADKWLGKAERTNSGMVKSINICNTDFTGTEIREMFELRSADFDIEYKDGEFIFTVRGYGHGVGMSQYGAEYMARQGSTYKEILMHYYQGTKLSRNISE